MDATVRAEVKVGPLTFRWKSEIRCWLDEASGLALSSTALDESLNFPTFTSGEVHVEDWWKPRPYEWNAKPEPCTVAAIQKIMDILKESAKREFNDVCSFEMPYGYGGGCYGYMLYD